LVDFPHDIEAENSSSTEAVMDSTPKTFRLNALALASSYQHSHRCITTKQVVRRRLLQIMGLHFKLFTAKSAKRGSALHAYANSAHHSTALRLAHKFAPVCEPKKS
jgi:hypothetical protein